jgi:hypothetical protein
MSFLRYVLNRAGLLAYIAEAVVVLIFALFV